MKFPPDAKEPISSAMGHCAWMSALDALDAHICVMEPEGLIVFVNAAWKRFAEANGYAADGQAGMGRNYRQICASSGTSESITIARMIDQVASGQSAEQTIVYPCHSSQERRWFKLHLSRIPGHDLVVAAHANVSAIKIEADLELEAALCDEATGVLSRRGMTRFAAQLSRFDTAPPLLAVVSLEDLPRLATQCGRRLANEFLHHLAARLKSLSPAEGAISHIGGRDLAILLPVSSLSGQPLPWARTLTEELSKPAMLHSRLLRTKVSCGMAIGSETAWDFDDLLDRADLALGEARVGQSPIALYDSDMARRAQRRNKVEAELHHTIARKQLSLAYQPQVDGKSGRLTGVEALLRWHHPELGLVPPSEFIPIAEASGLVSDLGQWVLETACRQIVHWQDIGMKTVPVAVNISGCDLHVSDFGANVARTVAGFGLNPASIELELTESVLISDIGSEAGRSIDRLVAAGFRFAIDDFGTGYSNMAYLRYLPLRKLKIDRSFIQDIGVVHEADAITSAIVRVAEALSIKTLAEGVESMEQHRALMSLGCREMQGFLFGKPCPPGSIAHRLAAAA